MRCEEESSLLHSTWQVGSAVAANRAQARGSAVVQAAEASAARRIFGLLPPDLAARFRELWAEFEASETPDAVFAKSLDRVQPVMANLMSGGGTWTTFAVTAAQLEARVGSKIARGAPALWHWLRGKTARFFS